MSASFSMPTIFIRMAHRCDVTKYLQVLDTLTILKAILIMII